MFFQFIEGDPAGNGKGLGGRTHRTDDPTRFLRGGESLRFSTSDLAPKDVDFLSFFSELVLVEDQGSGSEGVGLDAIGSRFQVPPMNRADHFRASEDQVFVTAEEILTTEILCSEVQLLECGASGSIQHQNPLP